MRQKSEWAFPAQLQPRSDDFDFDLDRVLDSLVMLRAEIPDDAFTAGNLGTERIGNGIVIGEDGLILTIGYLVTEASAIWLTTNRGEVLPGHALASDHASGLGLVQPLGRLNAPVLPRGAAAGARTDDEVLVAGHGGRSHSVRAKIIARHEFAGAWEYLLEDAIFTAPAHPQWGGSALIGEDGKLLGVGSLLVQETVAEKEVQSNMFVPVELLEPILGDMMRLGRPGGPARPWLGLYAAEVSGRLVVAGVASGGPAHQAALKTGDVLLEVAGEKLNGLADLFRKVWKQGSAGTEIPITIARSGVPSQVSVRSGDRQDFLKKPYLH